MNGMIKKMFGPQVSQFMGDGPPEDPVGQDDVAAAFGGMEPPTELPQGMEEPKEPEPSEVRDAVIDRMLEKKEATEFYQDKVRRENKEAAINIRRNRTGGGSSY
jgi:hypothetical protein